MYKRQKHDQALAEWHTPPMDPIAVERIQPEEEERVAFGCPEEGCIKVYQSHSSLQRHLDAGKHLLALERESPRTT